MNVIIDNLKLSEIKLSKESSSFTLISSTLVMVHLLVCILKTRESAKQIWAPHPNPKGYMHGYERLVFSMEPHLSLYIHDVEMGVRNRFFLLASFFLCWLFQLLLSLLLPQSSVQQQTISLFLLTSCYTIIPFLCDYIKLYVINNGAILKDFFL